MVANPARRMTADDVALLLGETSRTFALAVPLLSGRAQLSVGLAYLLFRCADTLEDASTWSIGERKIALQAFARMLDDGGADPRPGPSDRATIEDWLARDVSTHAGYTRLLATLPEVLGATALLPAATATAVRSHTRRTALGMHDMLDECAAGLPSLEALRQYCYVVAGIVGELLTQLFLQEAPSLEVVKGELSADARLFGEGLQLVNILKDEFDDQAEGRSFLPRHVARADLFALAAEDLRCAWRYIAALRRGGAPASFVAFTSFPCELAEATLEALRLQGPGAKVPRTRVVAMFERYRALSASGSGDEAREPLPPASELF
jgi:farnesyl-diphosphate farnesyltransferase